MKLNRICLLRLIVAAALSALCLIASAKPNRPQTIAVKNIQSAYTWSMVQDGATGGVSTGTMALVSKPSISGAARQFGISFQNSAGERYWSVFGNDAAATNFTYDVKV